jgi:hypothetical protein
MSSQATIDDYNETELLEMVRRNTGAVLKRSISRDRLVQIVYGAAPIPEELSGTTETRRTLQIFIEKNWNWINSQIPCKGENRGKCSIYPCPEGRHLDCYQSARAQIRATLKSDA